MTLKVGQKVMVDPETMRHHMNGLRTPAPVAGEVCYVREYLGHFKSPASGNVDHYYLISISNTRIAGERLWPIDDEGSDKSFEEMMNDIKTGVHDKAD